MITKILPHGKGFLRMIHTFLISIVLAISLQTCQQEEFVSSEDVILKTAVIPELTLNYPSEVNAGEDFNIVFSSTCGKIMIERGYIKGEPILDSGGNIIRYKKVYSGLTCDMKGLLWEFLGNGDFSPCTGGTFKEKWSEIGTYVYRAKISQKAVKKTGCPECTTFKGTQLECFMVNVVEGNSGTFTDSRDGHVYKWVTIGNQVWMAENLVFPQVNVAILIPAKAFILIVVPGNDIELAVIESQSGNTFFCGLKRNDYPFCSGICKRQHRLPSQIQ